MSEEGNTILEETNRPYFIGSVQTHWLEHDGRDRKMVLIDDFAFCASNGWEWRAFMGDIFDGASIPKPLWALFGSPFVGDYRRAAVIHDSYYKGGGEHFATRKQTDQMFLEAMRCDGVGRIKSRLMYAAVRLFGPRWEVET